MNRPTLIILVGPPGVGKTTYAHKYIEAHPGTVHLASDNIRKELHGDETIQDNPGEVFTIMQKRAIDGLNLGYDVVYDATNMTRKDRSGIIAACPKFAKIECHIVWAPIATCIERDVARKRTVGKEVIDRMLKRFQAPYYDEGIHKIKVVRPDDFNYAAYLHNAFESMKISHDNPHHTLNIYEHCCEAQDYIYKCDKDNTGLVALASMLHDIGKPYTKAFIDSKGNACDTAHYYQHQCVGAWMSYCLVGDFVPIDVAWLVSTHMEPFFNSKYYNKLPAYLKKRVDLLHEADKAAH